MTDSKLYYPFNYFHDAVCTLAIYGGNAPIIVKGNLVLRAYFKDDARTIQDIEHTNEYLIDEIFFETNKVIRQQLDDPYNGKRQLREIPFPQLGKEFCLIYNEEEIPSSRYDDSLTSVVSNDPYAVGVAIILKRDELGRIGWMNEREARHYQNVLMGKTK